MLSISPAPSAVIGAGAVRKNVYNAKKKRRKIPFSKPQQNLIWLLPQHPTCWLILILISILIIIASVQQLLRGFWGWVFACLGLQLLLGEEGLEEQEVWKHEEMFKTIPAVVTAQSTRVVFSQPGHGEFWDCRWVFHERSARGRTCHGSSSGSDPHIPKIARDPLCSQGLAPSLGSTGGKWVQRRRFHSMKAPAEGTFWV